MKPLDDVAVLCALTLHLGWILWVIFGAFWTKGHRWLTTFHLASLLWGIVVEIGPWPCPLTLTEEFFQNRAGINPYGGGFLFHYLGLLVYPNVSVQLLTFCGVAVCVANLIVYGGRWWRVSNRNGSPRRY